MTDPFSTVSQTELPRDRWGRPLITPPEGGESIGYQRVTTFVGCLEDTYHLSLWQQRMTVLGMARRRDLVLSASAITDPKDQYQKRTLNSLAKSAINAAHGDAAATTGTALHSFCERIDRGEPLANVPEEYEGDLDAYRVIMKDIEVIDIEGFVVVDDLRVGGSYDKVMTFTAAYLDAYEAEHGNRLVYPTGEEVALGDTVIGDIKTGNVDFGLGKIAMQLGVYANGEKYDHTLGTRSPIPGNPRKDWAVIIHLPAGTGSARLLWVNVGEGWAIASVLAPAVHAWRKRKDLSSAFSRVVLSATSGPSLIDEVNAAPSYAALKAIYAQNAARWTPGLTALAKARTEALKAAGV